MSGTSSPLPLLRPSPRPAAAEPFDYTPLLADGVTLTSIQRDAVEWLLPRSYAIYADGMGLGKTVVVLATILRRAEHQRNYRVLIGVRSVDLIEVWKTNIRQLIAPNRFVLVDCSSDEKPLPNSPDNTRPTIMFVTLTRLLLSFKASMAHIPIEAVGVPSKKRKSKAAAKPTLLDLQPAAARLRNASASFADAVLAAHNKELRNADELAVKDTAKYDTPVKRLLAHDLSRVDDRRKAFSHVYWADKVDTQVSWMPSGVIGRHGGPFAYRWNEVYLDEAHDVREHASKTFRASLFLQSDRKTHVTGTPIQNKPDDLSSAMLWINEPNVTRELGTVPNKLMRPSQLQDLSEQAYRAVRAMPETMFRRTTEQLVRECPEKLAEDERTAYLVRNTKRVGVIARNFRHNEERFVHDKYATLLKNVAQRLMLQKNAKNNSKDLVMEINDEEDEDSGIERLGSGNLLAAYMRALQTCAAACVIKSEAFNEVGASKVYSIHSTKMQMLVEYIRSNVKGEEKAVVYDQSVEVLEVAARALADAGIGAALFHGRVAQQRRQNNLRDWRLANGRIRVLLAQRRMGGVGHTWTEASHVVHLRPSFNPGEEDQANDRVWRIGQKRDVTIVRLLIANSVEELVIEIQEEKRRMTRTVMDNGMAAAATSMSSLDDTDAVDLPSGKRQRTVTLQPDQVFHSLQMLSKGQGRNGTTFGERNTLLTQRVSESWRARYAPPEWANEAAFAKRLPVFLDGGKCFSEASFMPNGTMLLRVAKSMDHDSLERHYKDVLSKQRLAADDLEAAMQKSRAGKRRHKGISDGSVEQGLGTYVLPLSVAVCPTSYRSRLSNNFYNELSVWAAENYTKRRNIERLKGIMTDPEHIGNAFAEMQRVLATHPSDTFRKRITVRSYDLTLLDTPAEYIAAMRQHFSPRACYVFLRGARSRGAELGGDYHIHRRPGGTLDLINSAALIESELMGSFPMDIDVLLSFSAAWHNSTCASSLIDALINGTVSGNGSPMDTDEQPPSPSSPTPEDENAWVSIDRLEAASNDAAIRGRCGFPRATVRSVLLPLLLEAGSKRSSASVRSMATAVLCLYALSASVTTRLYLLVARASDTGEIRGIAVAARPLEDVAIGMATYMRSGLQDEQQLNDALAAALARDLVFSPKIRRIFGARSNVWLQIESPGTWLRCSKHSNPRTLDWGDFSAQSANYVRK